MNLTHFKALALSILLTVAAPFASAEVSADTLFSKWQSPSSEYIVPVEPENEIQELDLKDLVDVAAQSLQDASSVSSVLIQNNRLVYLYADRELQRDYCTSVVRASLAARPLKVLSQGSKVGSDLSAELDTYVETITKARQQCSDVHTSSQLLHKASEQIFKILERLK
ncbi:MAG: hypothetical protein J7501_14355 [Bdellovibrio sp.]|nr:hypothetical protein [Bdellovibrio sp.]